MECSWNVLVPWVCLGFPECVLSFQLANLNRYSSLLGNEMRLLCFYIYLSTIVDIILYYGLFYYQLHYEHYVPYRPRDLPENDCVRVKKKSSHFQMKEESKHMTQTLQVRGATEHKNSHRHLSKQDFFILDPYTICILTRNKTPAKSPHEKKHWFKHWFDNLNIPKSDSSTFLNPFSMHVSPFH